MIRTKSQKYWDVQYIGRFQVCRFTSIPPLSCTSSPLGISRLPLSPLPPLKPTLRRLTHHGNVHSAGTFFRAWLPISCLRSSTATLQQSCYPCHPHLHLTYYHMLSLEFHLPIIFFPYNDFLHICHIEMPLSPPGSWNMILCL